MNDNRIHIALAADSNYVIPVTVALQSIFDNNKGNTLYIYLLYLCNSLKTNELDFLRGFVTGKGGTFFGVKVGEDMIDGFPSTRHGKATLLRLCLPGLLPQVDKVLYLDGDIIVEDDLGELFALNLTDNYVAGVKDTTGAYGLGYQTSMGISGEHCYFNAGVLLMNLVELRRLDLAGMMGSFIHTYYHSIGAPDQDFLNYLCQGRTLYVSPRYNMNYTVERDIANTTWGKTEVRLAKASPVIIHYIGAVKPWSVLSTHECRKRWWKYLKRTCFASYKPRDASFRNKCYRLYLKITRSFERMFTLKSKRRIGRYLPKRFKGSLKRTMQKQV